MILQAMRKMMEKQRKRGRPSFDTRRLLPASRMYGQCREIEQAIELSLKDKGTLELSDMLKLESRNINCNSRQTKTDGKKKEKTYFKTLTNTEPIQRERILNTTWVYHSRQH